MDARTQIARRFANRVTVDPTLGRQIVSYQGNKEQPGLRWMKYKEGFSRTLVERFIKEREPSSLLDPFSGLGTAPLVAAGNGVSATGIEIIPVGVLAANGIAYAANGLDKEDLRNIGNEMERWISCRKPASRDFAFPHVRITEKAFPKKTEADIAKAREFIDSIEDPALSGLLNLACMSVLESVSYTQKDGQYLRWDCCSDRNLRTNVNIGEIKSFPDALKERLSDMVEDIESVKENYGRRYPTFRTGSCLELLRDIPEGSHDLVVSSPPYANRYDYTRTYALELAWLGFDQIGFRDLRQKMLSATVENKSKLEWLEGIYGDNLTEARSMYVKQPVLNEVLGILNDRKSELNNPHIIRLLEGYFFEMAVVISEMSRIVKPGGAVIMVNDNVQYHGEEIPVDFVLSDFAEQVGFRCTNIWTLPRGKGNSSQQMAIFGRREIRKCVYEWVRK